MRNRQALFVPVLCLGLSICVGVAANDPTADPAKKAIMLKPCEKDPALTLADMEEEAAKDPKYLVASTVPGDLEVDLNPGRFAVTNFTQLHAFPDADSKTFAGLKWNYREMANCRVKDKSGVWWYATRNVAGELTYVSSEDAIPEKDYDEQARKAREGILKKQNEE